MSGGRKWPAISGHSWTTMQHFKWKKQEVICVTHQRSNPVLQLMYPWCILFYFCFIKLEKKMYPGLLSGTASWPGRLWCLRWETCIPMLWGHCSVVYCDIVCGLFRAWRVTFHHTNTAVWNGFVQFNKFSGHLTKWFLYTWKWICSI